MERLQKLIAHAGYCSRRKAEQYILEGKVKVNGEVIQELGRSFPMDVQIEIMGETLTKESDKVYYLLNKPRNCVTTVKDDRERPTVMELVPQDVRIYPVGRLDFDTTGALLMTNDGELTNKLIHPRYQIEKVYIATVNGNVDEQKMKELVTGVEFQGEVIKADSARMVKYNAAQEHSIVRVALKEGKNRQVKNLFEAIGYEVVKLNRESFAGISTVGLKQGQYRRLKETEINYLKNLR